LLSLVIFDTTVRQLKITCRARRVSLFASVFRTVITVVTFFLETNLFAHVKMLGSFTKFSHQ